jgi:hypothetical protein
VECNRKYRHSPQIAKLLCQGKWQCSGARTTCEPFGFGTTGKPYLQNELVFLPHIIYTTKPKKIINLNF